MDEKEIVKKKLQSYNYRNWWDNYKLTSLKRKYSYNDVAYTPSKRIKYLILGIIKDNNGATYYFTKRSTDKRVPTLKSNHQMSIESIKLFNDRTSLSLKTKLKLL